MNNEWIKNDWKAYDRTGCPVDEDVIVDVIWSDDTEDHDYPASEWNWFRKDIYITHWRLHKENKQEIPVDDPFCEMDWVHNIGNMPSTREEVDVVWSDGEEMKGVPAEFNWNIDHSVNFKIPNIIKWRLHKSQDGWIKNTGSQPVKDDTLVKVLLNTGVESVAAAKYWNWDSKEPTYITHWQLAEQGEFKGLETAYDQPSTFEINDWQAELKSCEDQQKYNKVFANAFNINVKAIPLSKRVSEAVNILTQKNISVDDVELIIDIYKRLEK